MRIFTNEEKFKAIELYIKYDFSPGAVMYELGYPTARSMIYRWYKTWGCGFAVLLDRNIQVGGLFLLLLSHTT